MTDNQTIACNFTAIDEDEQKEHKKNGEEVFNSVKEWTELSDGYAFRIPTETSMIEKAGAFIARERLCCPFFKFDLEITPNNGPVRLKLTGSKEVQRYIKENVIPQLESNKEEWELPENAVE